MIDSNPREQGWANVYVVVGRWSVSQDNAPSSDDAAIASVWSSYPAAVDAARALRDVYGITSDVVAGQLDDPNADFRLPIVWSAGSSS